MFCQVKQNVLDFYNLIFEFNMVVLARMFAGNRRREAEYARNYITQLDSGILEII